MHIVKTIAELRAAVSAARADGHQRVGLVPTMGNLHAGHVALAREAARHADFRVVSVFVNPLQFEPGSDYERYPRTLEQDALLLADEGVDLVFAPSVAEMYPHGETDTRVLVQGLSGVLCGAHRPGHFEGVTTVVSMLFNQVQPDVAVFGEKDFQQLVVIRRMVADLHWPIEIIGTATVREPDGLAMSTRNQYLSAEQRQHAPQLYAALAAVAKRMQSGERDFAALEQSGRDALLAAGIQPDYLAIRTPALALPQAQESQWVVLAAAWLGQARLIDNLHVRV